MKIKSLSIFVGLLVASSCTNQAQPITIDKFYPLAPGCDVSLFEADYFLPSAMLDVAAGSPQVFVGMRISGGDGVLQPAVNVTGATLERENRNRPLITQMVVNYRLSKRVGGTPKPYITNMSGPFNEAGVLLISAQLISPELGTALFDGLIPPPGPAPSSVVEDFVDILADVEFRGEFSATRHAFTTGTLTYPIRAFRSLPLTCGTGPGGVPFPYVRFPNSDPCGYGGQTFSQAIVPAPPACCAMGSPAGSGC